MTEEDKANLAKVAQLYTDSLKNCGAEPAGVGWRDTASQNLRFEKLATVIDATSDGITVNDLGCGYGAFYEYLTARGFVLRHFRGYDISKDMLVEARRRCAASEVELIGGAVLDKPADYSFASGIFNVRLEHAEEFWIQHILQTLANMNQFSIRGFAFNMLTKYVDYREDHLFYADPLYFFDICKREFGGAVSLLHDYPLYEWTILVHK